MKLLVTFDFPPERGGIQRYLGDIVVHTFTSDDLVIAAGACRRHAVEEHGFPCRIIRTGKRLSKLNRKLLLPSMALQVWRLAATRRESLTVHAGNVYAALAPWLISFLVPVRYHVYCYGTELLPLTRPHSLPPGKNRGSDQKTFDDASLLISVFSSQRLVRSGSICSGRWDVVHFAGPQW